MKARMFPSKKIFWRTWWKKEIGLLTLLGTITGILSAFGLIPLQYGVWCLIGIVLFSFVISLVWALIESANKNISDINVNQREGTRRSLSKEFIDNKHYFDYFFRQDLLDYGGTLSQKNFVSFRILKGRNMSSKNSDGIIYLECSEYKSYPQDVKIEAYDLTTNKPLRVDFINLQKNKKYYEFPFKICFNAPIKSQEEFAIAFKIILKNELKVLQEENEWMSISLSRYALGVKHLEFNVCLNFEPASVNVQYKKKNQFYLESNPIKIEEYIINSELEKKFDIKWSSTPYIIKWNCLNPKYDLYIINYKK